MGDISDYYRKNELDEHLDKSCSHQKQFAKWRQNNGKTIKLSNMTDEHLMNTINLINKRVNWRQEWKEPLLNELESRNECDATESDIY